MACATWSIIRVFNAIIVDVVTVTIDRQAPTLEDAQRAAHALHAEGARQVWLYGSLARGEAHSDSDIDLVAVFDDVNYRKRFGTTLALKKVARSASGRSVDVMVTDHPEWRIQREQVSKSFASAISCDLTLLSDTSTSNSIASSGNGADVGVDDSATVNWQKEQVMATSNAELALQRLIDARLSVRKILANREPNRSERELAAGDDSVEYEHARGARLIMMCEAAHLLVENATKALAVLSDADAKVLWSHNVRSIIKALGGVDGAALRDLLAAVPELVKSPDYLTMWRTRGAYGTPTEGRTAQEIASPAFTGAACVIACDVALYAASAVSDRLGDRDRDDTAGDLRRSAEALRGDLLAFDLSTGDLIL